MNVLNIAARELRATLNTSIGWLVMAAFLVISGIFWATMVSYYAFESTQGGGMYGPSWDTTDQLLAPFFGNTTVVLLMLTPALTMRVFSEELKQRTLELLLTSPVSTLEIVLGKYLGAFGFVAIMLLGTAYVPISLELMSDPDPGAIAGGYLSLLLLAGAILAMGLLMSAWTSNQIVAVVTTFAAALGMWILSWVSQDPNSVFATISFSSHLTDLTRGMMKVSDLVYFAAFIGFFLFATHQRVDSFRWR